MISKADWTTKKGHKDKPRWQDFWKDYLTGGQLTYLRSKPGIESLRKHSPTNTVGWDLNVPDVMRAAYFIKELKQYEINGGFPDLILLFLPNDHTGGTRGRSPRPAPRWPTTTSRLARSSRRSRAASSGRKPASSPLRTTRRWGGTT